MLLDLAFIATSIRSNEQGSQQVKAALEDIGITVTEVQTVDDCGHLDGVISLINKKSADMKFLLFQMKKKL